MTSRSLPRLLAFLLIPGCLSSGWAADQRSAYAGLVAPVLQAKCVACHGPSKQKGRLRMDSVEALLQGGGEGPAVVPGKLAESLMLERIALPKDDDECMPPSGEEPLTPAEVQLLRRWVEKGAGENLTTLDLGLEPALLQALAQAPRKAAAAPGKPRSDVPVASVDLEQRKKVMDACRDSGSSLVQVAQENPLLRFSALSVADRFGDGELQKLAPVAPDLLWMDLSRTQVTDSGLRVLATMKNLTRLHLENTAISDGGLVHLAGLSRLEYLNLYQTGVTDQGLSGLKGLRNLKSLYVWQTKVTPAGAAQLRQAIPGLVVNLGWDQEAKPSEPSKLATVAPGSPTAKPSPVASPSPAPARNEVQESLARAQAGTVRLLAEARERLAAAERQAQEAGQAQAQAQAQISTLEHALAEAKASAARLQGETASREILLSQVRGKGGLESVEKTLADDLAKSRKLAEEAANRFQSIEADLKAAIIRSAQAQSQAVQEAKVSAGLKAQILQMEEVANAVKQALDRAP